MSVRLAGLAGLVLALSAASGGAQELIEWGASDYWSVLVDPSLGNGCLIQSEFDDGSLVRIGLDRTTGFGYVTAFNEGWGDIEEDALYPVNFALDGESFEGEAKGIYLEGMPGADIEFDSVDFFMSIATRQTMTMFNVDGEEVLSIDLTGTLEGLEAVLACQEAQG